MTDGQRGVLTLGFLSLCLTMLFAPFKVEAHDPVADIFGGRQRPPIQRVRHAPVWSTPEMGLARDEELGTTVDVDRAELDSAKLILWVLLIGMLTAGGLFVTRETRGQTPAQQFAPEYRKGDY